MKKLSILAMVAFLLVGLSACEKKESSGNDTAAGTETTAGSENASSVTTPPADMTTSTEVDLPVTNVEYYEDSHNFGEIKEGDKVNHTIKFKNTGSNPLVISNVKPSCGCTTPEWSQGEIAPGQEGFVKVEFDSKGKTGVQKKSVTITANTEPKAKILSFSGEVIGG